MTPELTAYLERLEGTIRSMQSKSLPAVGKPSWTQPRTVTQSDDKKCYQLNAGMALFRVYVSNDEPKLVGAVGQWRAKKHWNDSFFADVPKYSASCAELANAVCAPLYAELGLEPNSITIDRSQLVMVIRMASIKVAGESATVSFSGTVAR